MQILRSGRYEYEALLTWGLWPPELRVGEVAAVAVDRQDRVYLFTRGEHPIIVLDREGTVQNTWGHGCFRRPHGLHIGADDALYCTDDGDHTVSKFSLEGRLLLRLGIPGKPAPFMSNKPFHRCTHTALSPTGEIYVADGYGNACIHQYTPNGQYVRQWGRCGRGRGEFYVPHNIVCDAQGWVYVADRENHRIQVFSGTGEYETEWGELHRPCALSQGGRDNDFFYVGEVGPALASTLDFPNLGPRISILNRQGQVVSRLGTESAGVSAGQFIAPHGIAVDSTGDIYVAEVSTSAWPAVFPGKEMPRFVPSIRKLRLLSA